MKELSVWDLIKNNQFEKACEKADEEYEENADAIWNLRNKIYALFHLKKYLDIILLSKKLIDYRKGETDMDFITLGIASWVLGDTAKSVEAWQESQNSIYKDSAGGIEIQVFLYFASIKTGQDILKKSTIKTIKKLLKSKRAIGWPRPLGHYLLNEMTDRELFSYPSAVPILRERELCQAHFVCAIKKMEAGDEDGYYQKLKDCISYGPNAYLEQMYYMAKGELEMAGRV